MAEAELLFQSAKIPPVAKDAAGGGGEDGKQIPGSWCLSRPERANGFKKKKIILHYIDTIIDSMLRIKWCFQRSSKRLYKNWEMGKSIGK